ncbi:MAG: NAD-dependent epimerase/dehydratase family protein [Carboxydocellales bacterium]
MKKNILIIGGSYFIGRVFVMALSKKSDYSIHLMNRGRNPLRLPGVEEHVCDRKDISGIRKVIPPLEFHAVIDLCADFPREIKTIIENLPGKIGQYIYISTCTVYKPSLDLPKFEDSPKPSAPLPGPMGEYGFNKWLLELETKNVCERHNIPYTILRPAFVYGPFNYAPRESFFFDLILSNQTIPVPENSLALFQFVYVKDIASILFACLGNEKVYNNTYNLSAEELIAYDKLIEVFEQVSGEQLNTERVSIETINRNNIKLPFPLEQHELYSGSLLAGTLNFKYTPFSTGMKETFEFYKKYFYKTPTKG